MLRIDEKENSVMSSSCDGVPPVPTGSTFTVWDYLIFCVVLAISAAIGLYYAFAGGKQKTTQEFLLADKNMSAFPVAMSLFASFFSTAVLLGAPAEVYTQGSMSWMCVWGAMLTPIVGAAIFGPFFHRLKVLSAFEYLELRYKSKSVRIFGCVMIVVKNTITMGITMFGPATAFTEVTGVPLWAGILIIGLVCVFYTTLGGMKAVIWTDVFQATLMLVGLLAPIIQGCIETGGIENAWQLAEDDGRIEFFNFNPDPTVRHTFWTLVVGNFFNWLPSYSVEQQMIQRYPSTKSTKQATIALLLNIPGIFVMITLCQLLGVIIYGYYAPMNCDPLKSGRVSDPNQLAPRFVMDIFDFAPGIPGLYIGSLFAGALSTISSLLNATATVVWEDIFKMFRPAREASDKTATLAAKILGVVFAATGIGMAFAFSNAGGTVLQMTIAFSGAASAPTVGIFMLGFFFPWANWIGALVGGVCGFAFPMWISIGAYVEKPPVMKPMYYDVECCDVTPDNATSSYFFSTSESATTPTTTVPEVSGIVELYMVSYMWYTTIGMLTAVVVGLIVSFLTGYTKPRDVDPKLLIPYVDTFWCCFPESCRSKFRCGIDFTKVSESDSTSDFEDPEKSVEMIHNGMDFVCVYPDQTDTDGKDEKLPGADEEKCSDSFNSSEEPSVLAKISNHSADNRRIIGCENDAFECKDNLEIYKL